MKKLLSFICIFSLLAGIFAPSAYALVPIDPERPSSLTITYKYGEKLYEGLPVKIYRVASVAPDGTYDLCGDFADYAVNIYGITSQSEWRVVTSTLASYIAADNLAPTQSLLTDASGTAAFSGLVPGMYLTLSAVVESPQEIVTFENFLTVIPRPSDTGDHDYDVTAIPKCSSYTPTDWEIEYKIIKLWRDEGAGKLRPDTVEIDLYKDGVLDSTQILSADNKWTYTWSAPDDGSVWNAVERKVAGDYTVTVERNGNSFIITNTLETDDPPAPPTGDTLVLWHLILPMGLAGGVILLIAEWRKRREYEN